MAEARNPDHFPKRINQYVPAMEFAADLHDDGRARISLGSPAIADVNGIVAAVSVTGGVTLTPTNFNGAEANDGEEWDSDAPFGRAVVIDFSAAGTPVVTIKGRDYLGQLMQENITGNGTTAVNGLKAFKSIYEIVVASGVTGTIDVGTQDVLGLPYKCLSVEDEFAAGARAAPGTLVAPVLTDPQTATTGDPRGTYNPTTALDGSTKIEIAGVFDDFANASGNGGYHGIKQFNA